MMAMLTLDVRGDPALWCKTRGSLEGEWIGYSLSLERFVVGLSMKRVSWLTAWLEQRIETGKADVKEVSEVWAAWPGRLGRWCTCAFSGPVYAWLAAVHRGGFISLPQSLLRILAFIAAEVRLERESPCRSPTVVLGEAFRADAGAEGQRIVVGVCRLACSDDTKMAS